MVEHGGNIFEIKRKYNTDVIDFSANINPVLFDINKIILENTDSVLHYPDSWEIKQKIASLHNINSDNLLIGNGSIELIYLIPKALQTEKALIITPTFMEYEAALKLNNSSPVFLNAGDFSKVLEYVKDVDLVFLCNPNNPTGTVISQKEILSLLEVCKKNNVVLVIDEAFIDFIQGYENITMVSKIDKSLLVLRSLTKFFAIPGLRLGYVTGHKDLISKISDVQYPWSINSLALAVGKEVVGNKEYGIKTREFIEKEREYLVSNLKKINNIKVYDSKTNFILFKLKNSTAKELNEKLIKQGVVVRDCSSFRGLDESFVRIAVRTRIENIKLINAIEKSV
jgi:threonine-phosphate decarboxylase